ncbi:PIN domain protein [Candidatus Electrothrix sp.]|uniref:PIN domain protein n=1 Tax=Candidatus Electrothrix sp. TaxID=2170559 RepID=UPI0040561111
MKIQRIYTDTSVIGGCFDSEFTKWSNGLMQDFRLGTFKPLLSEIVSAEIENAPAPVQELYQELLALHSAELISVTEEMVELADGYQQHNILTPKYYDDGLHIAIATVTEADLLVSWNFKHIVRAEKIRLFNAVNLENGYRTVQIYSPREVTVYGAD